VVELDLQKYWRINMYN